MSEDNVIPMVGTGALIMVVTEEEWENLMHQPCPFLLPLYLHPLGNDSYNVFDFNLALDLVDVHNSMNSELEYEFTLDNSEGEG